MIDISKFGMCAEGREGFAVTAHDPARTLQVMEISKVADPDFFTNPYAEAGGATVQEAKNGLIEKLLARGWTQQNVDDFFASPHRMNLS